MNTSNLPFGLPFNAPIKNGPFYGPFGGSSGPPKQGLLAYYKSISTDTIGLSTKLIDRKATGTHEAIPAVSLKFSDVFQYTSLNTPITTVGDIDIKFSTYGLAPSDVHRILAGGTYNVDAIINAECYLDIDTNSSLLIIRLNKNGSASNLYITFNISSINTSLSNDWRIRRIDNSWYLYVNEVQVDTTKNDSLLFGFIIGRISNTYNRVVGYMWDFYIEDSTGIKLKNSLATGTGATAVSEVGPDITLNGFTLPDDWTESALFGHSWNGADGYMVADGNGTYDDGAILPASKYGSESGTLYTGTARQNIAVKGYAGTFDGTAYAALTNPITLSGDFKIVFCGITISNLSASRYFFGGISGDADIEFRALITSGTLRSKIGAVETNFAVAVAAGIKYTISYIRNGENVTVIVDDGITQQTDTKTFISTGVQITRLFDRQPSPTSPFFGSCCAVELYNGAGVIVNKWITQSANNVNQITIYDVEPTSPNNATLTGATLPFFTTETSNSYFATYGGQVSGVNVIPYPAGTQAFKGVFDGPDNLFLLNAPQSPEFYQSDTLNEWIDTSGIVLDIAPEDITNNGYVIFGSKAGLVYETELTGTLLSKAQRYAGATP